MVEQSVGHSLSVEHDDLDNQAERGDVLRAEHEGIGDPYAKIYYGVLNFKNGIFLKIFKFSYITQTSIVLKQ
jgi:hypothetical protein